MKKFNKWFKVLALMGVIVFLTACGSTNEPISANSTGIWDRYIIYNLSQFILWLSDLFGGNYAIGIILFTVIIRVLLIPLFRIQIKSQRQMQELQPEIEAIKEKYPNKDKQSMELMQQEQAQLMEDRGVNQFAGILPLLIQLPLMIALYQAILRTNELQTGTFLWMNLGEADPYFVLPILAALLTFLSSYLTAKSNPVQNVTTKTVAFIAPVMILFITIGLPSAIALYFVVSNGITLLQTLIFNNPYKIIAERQAKIDEEKERQRRLRREYRRLTGKKKKK